MPSTSRKFVPKKTENKPQDSSTIRREFLANHEGLVDQERKLRKSPGLAQQIARFDAKTRLKIFFLQASVLAIVLTHSFWVSHWFFSVIAALALGVFFMPYIRVFMHSVLHWGVGGNWISRFWFKHFVSLTYSVPQTGYGVGHIHHHKYDNDFSEDGKPKDLQSTYIFSKTGKNTHPMKWVLYYAFIFQWFVTLALVVKTKKLKNVAWYLIEGAFIISSHVLIYKLNSQFYTLVYLPATLFAWFGSSTVLYMMHGISITKYKTHPTLNSDSRFFNSFGDNDGYHLEHSLFPAAHPILLPQIQDLMGKLFPKKQILSGHYASEFMKRYLLGRRK